MWPEKCQQSHFTPKYPHLIGFNSTSIFRHLLCVRHCGWFWRCGCLRHRGLKSFPCMYTSLRWKRQPCSLWIQWPEWWVWSKQWWASEGWYKVWTWENCFCSSTAVKLCWETLFPHILVWEALLFDSLQWEWAAHSCPEAQSLWVAMTQGSRLGFQTL